MVVVAVVDIVEMLVGRVLLWGLHHEHVLLLGGARMQAVTFRRARDEVANRVVDRCV